MLGFYLLPKGFRQRHLVYKYQQLNDNDESFVEYTYKKLFGRLYYLVRVTSNYDTNSLQYVLEVPDVIIHKFY